MNIKLASAAVVLAGTSFASAGYMSQYLDSTGDIFDGGLSNLDISFVGINHDADNVYMTIEMNGYIGAGSDWGKYMIAIDAYGGGGTDNPWGRNMSYGGVEADRFIGTWVDGGGGIAGYGHFDGWYSADSGLSSTSDDYSITVTISRSWLGADVNSFDFDVMTTGNGADPGIDHLSRSDQATGGWGETSTSGAFLTYNLPAPGAIVLLGIAGLAGSRRRR